MTSFDSVLFKSLRAQNHEEESNGTGFYKVEIDGSLMQLYYPSGLVVTLEIKRDLDGFSNWPVQITAHGIVSYTAIEKELTNLFKICERTAAAMGTRFSLQASAFVRDLQKAVTALFEFAKDQEITFNHLVFCPGGSKPQIVTDGTIKYSWVENDKVKVAFVEDLLRTNRHALSQQQYTLQDAFNVFYNP